jgi:hypothetical protein
MAKLLSAEQIVTLLVQPVGNLRPGDLGDLTAALERIPGSSSHGDLDEHRAQEKPLSELLTGGFGAAH